MKLFKALAVCAVLTLPLVANAADIGTIRTIPGVGDANRDGQITKDDVTLLGEYLFAARELSVPAEWNMDFNGDGKVSILDMFDLARVVSGFGGRIPAPAQQVLVGDVDGDGSITQRDFERLLGYLFRGEPLPGSGHPASADVNCDNKVSLADAYQLAKKIAKSGS